MPSIPATRTGWAVAKKRSARQSATTATGLDVVHQTVKLIDASITQVARFTGRADGREDTAISGHSGPTDMLELERWTFTFRKIDVHDTDGNTSFADDLTGTV